MSTLYLDVSSGISGDMFIGAMLDLGVSLDGLEREVARLGLAGYRLQASHGQRGNIAGIKFDVQLSDPHAGAEDHEGHHAKNDAATGRGRTRPKGPSADDHAASRAEDDSHPHHTPHAHGRTFAEIKDSIARSRLSDWVKARAISLFSRVALAEGKIHGRPPDEVHFHEVGALDSIVDMVGACICLEQLGKPRVLAGSVVDGHGWVKCAHGRFAVPTAATLEILGARGIAITQCEEPHELVTPTGAALLAEFVEGFEPMQNLVASRIGYGLGTRENKSRPNILRAVLSERPAAAHDWETDTVAVLETNLDDLNAEILGAFIERALQAGALDVFHTPVQMKKSRPGVMLTVLSRPEAAEHLTELILRETSAFGVRRHLAERRKLRRATAMVDTDYGKVQVKFGLLEGQVIQVAPEFESCREAAQRAGVPLKAVYDAATRAAREGC